MALPLDPSTAIASLGIEPVSTVPPAQANTTGGNESKDGGKGNNPSSSSSSSQSSSARSSMDMGDLEMATDIPKVSSTPIAAVENTNNNNGTKDNNNNNNNKGIEGEKSVKRSTSNSFHRNNDEVTAPSPAAIPKPSLFHRFLRRLPPSLQPGPNTAKELACHLCMTVAGWSDASAGALIPYMQTYFHISYTVVSLLFVSQCVGFIAASFAVNYGVDKWGLGKVITFGAGLQAIADIFMIPPINFPVMAVAYVFQGFGMALQDATANAYVAGLPNSSHKLGLMHGSYGLGALISPLIGTAFVESGIRFSLFYLTLLAMSTISTLVLLWVFKLKPENTDNNGSEEEEISSPSKAETEVVGGGGQRVEEIEMKGITAVAAAAAAAEGSGSGSGTSTPSKPQNGHGEEKSTTSLKVILSSKVVWISCLFLIAYVGSEVTMGGWIVSFILKVRNGPTSSGYVATGFWAGIALGRLFTPRLNLWVGERRIIFYYLLLATGFEFIIWFVPSLVGDAIASGVLGVVLGPFYPLVISHTTKILPRSMHTGAVGFAASFGQVGAAVFPFLTGILAQTVGIKALPVVMIVLFVIMGCLWSFMPDVKRREE